MKKKIYIFILMIISLLTVSCDNNKIKVGFSEGFGGFSCPYVSAEFTGSKQKIDNTNITLYIGLYENNNYSQYDIKRLEFVGMSLYFTSSYNAEIEHVVDEDLNIAEHYLIRTISPDEMKEKNYNVKSNIFGKLSFKHKEKLTIPAEVLKEYSGDTMVVKILAIYEENGEYVAINGLHYVQFNVEVIDDNVVLSK